MEKMSTPPPFRQRPNLYLALTPLTGSPRWYSNSAPTSRAETPLPTPTGGPFATTLYSPFRSAGLKAPWTDPCSRSDSYRTAMPLKPRPRDLPFYNRYNWLRIRRIFGSKAIWLFLMGLALILWWFNGGSQELDEVKLNASGFGKELLLGRTMQDLQFYPASNPKIHYIGRWTSTPNRLRKDGTFPGVYFDILVTNTSTLLLALRNHIQVRLTDNETAASTPSPRPLGHLSFRPVSANNKPAPPVSLLARVDDDEYVLLPNASLLVSICDNSLDRRREHHIRIVAPMTDDSGRGVVELEGLWLSKGGRLRKVPGSVFSEEYADEDLFMAENEIVGERDQMGFSKIKNDGMNYVKGHDIIEDEEVVAQSNQDRKKILEVVTDSPGSFMSKQNGKGRRKGGADGLLSGVIGWEYLLGEMFGVDHVGIGVDGMCLTQDCIGGTGEPAGIGDVFFRSGPYGSEYFEHSWPFSSYVPEVLVLNIGGSDEKSFRDHLSSYNKTEWELTERFEDAYVSLVQGIRRLAYPKHPAIVQSQLSDTPGILPPNTPAAIPIFIMRPLRGQLEQATQNAVAKLRADGDKSVFWLDTSGWLDLDSSPNLYGGGDFFLDNTIDPPKWRLTEQGNQRVAIFLHMHVCRYLAGEGEKCAFLPHEVYQGKVFDPEEASFDRFLESEKERKLKDLFWGHEENSVEQESRSMTTATTTVASIVLSATA